MKVEVANRQLDIQLPSLRKCLDWGTHILELLVYGDVYMQAARSIREWA